MGGGELGEGVGVHHGSCIAVNIEIIKSMEREQQQKLNENCRSSSKTTTKRVHIFIYRY